MNHRNDNTQVEVKRDWKYVFKCYLRFLQFGASKIFQLFKYCVHKFGAESIFLLGLYLAHNQIKLMRVEFGKVIEDVVPVNRFESKNKIDF